MGNDVSFTMGKKHAEAARYGNVCVQTDKSTYFGGDTVTGKIYLNLLLPYPGNQLYLKLVGKEHVHVVHTRTEHRTVQRNGQSVTETKEVDELCEESHEIIKMITPVYNWVTLMPGQYSIPFAFMLPGTLPSSFHQEGPRYVANISYKLEAVLEPSFKSEPKLKYKQVFIVRQPVKSAMQGVGNEIRTNLTACCSGKGTNTLRAKFEKTYYSPGETAQVIMQLDNTDSQLNNTNITFNLKQKLKLSAKGKPFDRDLVKVSRTLPGIGAGSASDSNLIAINLPAFQGGDYSKLKTFNIMHHLIHLKEDNNILNCATKGKLITSEYFLEVACPMDGCCAPTPSISCPIEIYYPEIQLVQIPVPANWAPQEIGLVNVAFNAGMPNMNVNIDMGGMMGMNVTSQQPQGNVQMNVNMGMPNMTVTSTTTNSQNQSFGQQDNVQMNVNMGMPGMTVTQTTSHNNEHVEMNMGFGGMHVQQTTTSSNSGFGEHHNENVNMNVNMGFGMPGMNMNVTSHTSSNGRFE